MNKLVIVSSE